MKITKNFTLRRNSSCIIARHKYGLGLFVFTNVASLVKMDVCQKKHGNVSRATYIICDLLLENRTYEAISNFEKGAKINFVSNMASRSTVSL